MNSNLARWTILAGALLFRTLTGASCRAKGDDGSPTPSVSPAYAAPVYAPPAPYPLLGGGAGYQVGKAIAIDAADRILVAGSATGPSGSSDMALWRYTPDNEPDSGFGTEGLALHDGAAGGSEESATAVALVQPGNPDSDIVVAGYGRNVAGNLDMVLWLFSAAGVLQTWFGTWDYSYGGTGWVRHHNAAGGNDDDVALGIAVDSIGRFVVTGYSWNSDGQSEMVVWRYRWDGLRDNSFGDGGVATHLGGVWEAGRAVLLENPSIEAGRIFVAGWKSFAPPGGSTLHAQALWCLTFEGVLDVNFSDGGVAVAEDPAGHCEGAALAREPETGRILVAGHGTWMYEGPDGPLPRQAMRLWAYHSTGAPDLSFGDAGTASFGENHSGGVSHHGTGIALDSAGRLVIAGYSTEGNDTDVVAWRYSSSGVLGTSFYSAGVWHDPHGLGGYHPDQGLAVVVHPVRGIRIAGHQWNGTDSDAAVWNP